VDIHTVPVRRGGDLSSVLGSEVTPEPVVAPRVMVVEGRVGGRAAVLLGAEGLSVETIDDTGEVALRLAVAFDPHLVLVESVAITDDVVELCKRLEDVTTAPVVLFCERREESEVIAGFAAGARTVVSEPVGGHELVARVRAVLRRARLRTEPLRDVLTVGPIVLDRSRRVVTVDGQVVPMPRREFEIAEMLIQRAGEVVSRSTLLRELWGSSADTKSLAVQVGRLRARLAAIEGISRIVTVRGVGYRFVTTEELSRRNPPPVVAAE
jgi:two-component system response regulator RegX3